MKPCLKPCPGNPPGPPGGTEARRYKVRQCVVLLLAVLLCLAGPAALADTQGQPAPSSDPSAKNLKELVRFLENDAERNLFIDRLKLLIQEKERSEAGAASTDGTATTEVAPSAANPFFRALEQYSKKSIRDFKKLITRIGTLPEAFKKAGRFILDEDHRARLLNLILCLMAGIFVAAWISFIFKRRGPQPPEDPVGWPRRLAHGIASIFVGVIPYVVLLLVVYGLFDVFHSLPEAREIVLVLLVILLYYQLAYHTGRAVLSPYNPFLRLAPIQDPGAQYLWSWFVRLAKYTALYMFVLDGPLVYVTDSTTFFAVRNTLVLVFPFLITVFIIRFALRTKADRQASPAKRDPAETPLRVKLLDLAWKYWPFPAILYVWTVSLLILGRYAAGADYLVWATVGTTALIMVCLVVMAGVDYALVRLYPDGQAAEGRFIVIIRAALRVLIGLAGIVVLAQLWGLPVTRMLGSRAGSEILARFLAIAVTIGVAAVVMSGSQIITDWLLEEREGEEVGQKRKTLTPIVNTGIKALTVFVTIIVILDRFNVNIGPILAGAGIIGLGVGLGAQSLVKDFINGLFILFQDMISVGDWVRIGDKDGLVEAVSLRAVKIRDISGNVHIIPNSAVESVTNMTKVFSRYVFDIGVSYRENVDEVIALLEELGRAMYSDPVFGKDIIEPFEILGLQRFDDSAVIIRARVTTRPMQQWAVGREFNRRIKNAFDENGIEIPFPHRTVYMGEPKDGPAAPLHVSLGSAGGAPPSGRDDEAGE